MKIAFVGEKLKILIGIDKQKFEWVDFNTVIVTVNSETFHFRKSNRRRRKMNEM
jgi:hypothetical protein